MNAMGDTAQLPKPRSLEAAEAWFADAAYEDWESAWSRVEPAYRRVLAERTAVDEGLDLEDPETVALIEGAAEEWHDQALWSSFGEDVCLAFLQDAMSLDSRAWITQPMPVALDCELVLMIDYEGRCDAAEAPPGPRPSFEIRSPVGPESPAQSFVTSAVQFYMRRDDYGDWLIAGFNEEPPGWPTSRLSAACESTPA